MLGGAGFLYEDVTQLRAQLQLLVSNPDLRHPAQESAMLRATRYSWEAVTDQYEVLFHQMAPRARMLSSKRREGVDSRE